MSRAAPPGSRLRAAVRLDGSPLHPPPWRDEWNATGAASACLSGSAGIPHDRRRRLGRKLEATVRRHDPPARPERTPHRFIHRPLPPPRRHPARSSLTCVGQAFQPAGSPDFPVRCSWSAEHRLGQSIAGRTSNTQLALPASPHLIPLAPASPPPIRPSRRDPSRWLSAATPPVTIPKTNPHPGWDASTPSFAAPGPGAPLASGPATTASPRVPIKTRCSTLKAGRFAACASIYPPPCKSGTATEWVTVRHPSRSHIT